MDGKAYLCGTWEVSVLAAGLDRTGTRRGCHRGGIVPIEEAVEEEREADDDEEAADPKGGGRAFAGKGNEHHEPEPDAHQGDPGAAMATRGTDAVAIVAVHRLVETVRIHFRRRHQPLFDHRNPLAD